MLKQSPSRNQRSKGFKVKHFLQICLLLAICFWLLNQLKHSYDEKKAYEDITGNISDEVQSDGAIKLGRKDLHPRVDETTLEGESQGDKAELEEEIEEIKSEDVEDDGRGGGDDEIDGHDQERAEEEEPEEVEDLIDVDDRERDVGIEEQESEEKSNPLVDTSSINDQAKNEGVRNSREAREENYKADDASSSVVHNTRTLSTKIEIGGLRKIKVIIESGGDNGAVHGEQKVDESNFANSFAGSLTEAIANERLMIEENFLNAKENTVPEKIPDSKSTASEEHTFLQAVSMAQNGCSNEAIKSRQSNVNSILSTISGNLDSVDSGVAIVSKSMVTECIINLNATPPTINENNDIGNSQDSESVANERADTTDNL